MGAVAGSPKKFVYQAVHMIFDGVFERQQNALLGAAQRDDVVAIKNILQSGAAVSYANSVGQTALHIATLWGNASAVEALVQAGAAVDQVNDLGAQTPLHL